jgi:hypothetical protein
MPIALQELDIAKPLIFRGLSWLEFKTIEPILDRPGIRLSYLDGALEITDHHLCRSLSKNIIVTSSGISELLAYQRLKISINKIVDTLFGYLLTLS